MFGLISIGLWAIGVIVCAVYALWGDAICNWYWAHWSFYYQWLGIADKELFYRLQTASVVCMAVLLILLAIVFAIGYFRSR